MRHRLAGRHLNRTSAHRKAMRRNMAASLIQHGAIRTTQVKAKELRRFIEPIITIARDGTLHARRRVLAKMPDRPMTDDEGEFLNQTVVQKLFDEIAPRYADRPGGYTRIIRLDERRIGDAGSQVIIQLVEEGESGSAEGGGPSRRKRRAARRHEAAAATGLSDQSENGAEDTEEAEDTPAEEKPSDEETADQPEPEDPETEEKGE